MQYFSQTLITGVMLFGAVVTAPAVEPVDRCALFHLSLLKSEPLKDSTVASPRVIRLWFSEKPNLTVTRVFLKNAAGKDMRLGKPAIDTAAKAPVTLAVTDTLAPGKYTLTWATASSDGHAVNGNFSFTVRNQ